MNSKKEVKRLLAEAGSPHLFSDENYMIATVLTSFAEKKDPLLKQHFNNIKYSREEYKRDLIIKNKGKRRPALAILKNRF